MKKRERAGAEAPINPNVKREVISFVISSIFQLGHAFESTSNRGPDWISIPRPSCVSPTETREEAGAVRVLT
jgi:hypothetical protein